MILKKDNKQKELKKNKNMKQITVLLTKLNEFRKIHYIELLILLFNLAQGLRASVNFPSFYSKVCNEIYSSTPSTCLQLKKDKIAENIVQKETARWLMYNEIVTFLPNLISAMFFGSFGDKYGRKVPTMIAISSMVVHNFLYMLFVSVPYFPVYILTIEAAAIALGGTKTVFVSAQYAEAAHQTKDKSKLTERFSILTACISCAIFVAGNISPLLLTFCSLQWVMVVGQIVMTATFAVALLLHSPSEKKNIIKPPTEETIYSFSKAAAPQKSFNGKLDHQANKNQKWFKEMLYLYKSAWNSWIKRRPDHGRIHLLLFCFVGLIYSCADSGMDTVTTLYVYHAPLSWTPSIFSQWMATMSVVQLIGGVVGTHLLKRVHFSDYTVVLVGLTSAALKMACTGAASQTWVMYLALFFGCMSNIGISSLRSLITQLGSESEISELTSMLSIVMGWSQLSGSLICNNIYTATVHYYIGFTFAVVAFLLMICFFIILGVVYDTKKILQQSKVVARNSSSVFYI